MLYICLLFDNLLEVMFASHLKGKKKGIKCHDLNEFVVDLFC